MLFLNIFFLKNKIAVWDLRKFQEPLCFNEFQTNIKKIQFSPSKKHKLAVLTEKTTELDLYRITNIDENLQVEPIYCKESLLLNQKLFINSIII